MVEDGNAVLEPDSVQDLVDPMLVVADQQRDILAAVVEQQRTESGIGTHVAQVPDWGIDTVAEVEVYMTVVPLPLLLDEIHVEMDHLDLDELVQLEHRTHNWHKGSTYWVQVVEVDSRCIQLQPVVARSLSDLETVLYQF
jgi:hypothetical protein